MNYEWELEQLENRFRQEMRDFAKFREKNNDRYEAAKTIEEKAKINDELENKRKFIHESQKNQRENLKAEYNEYKKSQEKIKDKEKAPAREKMNKLLFPDYSDREKVKSPKELEMLEEEKRREYLKEKDHDR